MLEFFEGYFQSLKKFKNIAVSLVIIEILLIALSRTNGIIEDWKLKEIKISDYIFNHNRKVYIN